MPLSFGRSSGALARIGLLVVVATALTGMIVTLLLPAAVFATEAIEIVQRDVFDVPPLPDADPVIENSFIYAADGSEIAEISFRESRLVVALDDVPQDLINAVIATEDASFWTHDGINVESMIRAAAGNIVAGEIESGASTITQQFVKNAYIDAERRTEQSYDRKVQEALWAVQIEEQLSKEEILEGYLNRIPLGQGVYGVGKAAERYFSATLDDLTLGQAATIAGMIRSPEGNNPLVNPDNARERRDIVLTQMAREGYISTEQAAATKLLGLDVKPTESAASEEPFWVDFVTRQLYDQAAADPMKIPQDLLDALGDTQDARITSVFQTGLRIHTTLDLTMQAEAEDSIRAFLTYEDEPREEVAIEPFGGIVTVVPGDGAIRTMAIGPFDYGTCDPEDPVGVDDEGRILCDRTKFNPLVPADSGSTRAGRQPGSSFKPMLITAALEAGFPPGWTADAKSGQKIDGPAGCSDQETWRPTNSGGGSGYLDMYSGVRASSNVFHATLISEVGPEKVVDTAERAGIFASEIQPVCSIALGTGEVFPLEMASAYATLAAKGLFCQPYAISRIETRDGKLLYEHAPDCNQAIEESIALRVIDIMKGPVGPGGTAKHISGDLAPHPVRGKTGTTQDYRDAWFVGYIPQLATAAWVGYPNGVTTYDCDVNPGRCTEASNLCFDVDTDRNTRGCVETRFLSGQRIAGRYERRIFGGTIPAPMWSRYMQAVTADLEPGSYPKPGSQPGATVPDLSGVTSIAEMRKLVEGANLRLFVDTVEDYRPENTFVDQSPGAGEKVPAGRAVVVSLSDGSQPKPIVPDYVGRLGDAASTEAVALGFTVAVVREPTNVQSQDGRVLEQSLTPGDEFVPDDHPTLRLTVAQYDPTYLPPAPPAPDDGKCKGKGKDKCEPTPAPSPSAPPTPPPGDDGDGGAEG